MTPAPARAPLPIWLKLLTGVAGTALIACAAYRYESQRLLADLGRRSAQVMLANGIADGAAHFGSTSGWTFRVARLSGTADATTRAKVSADLAAREGIAGVEWRDAG